MENFGEKVIVLIPARYESRRFPGKLLSKLNGKSILSRVYNSTMECRIIENCFIVVDDERLAEEADRIGAPFIRSLEDFICGSDRCFAASEHCGDFDILVNVQADQPLLDHRILNDLLVKMHEEPQHSIASVMTALPCEDASPNVVKVKVDACGMATGFDRDLNEEETVNEHIGIYAFRKKVIEKLKLLSPTKKELDLGLEQLRWIEHGFPIRMVKTRYSSKSVNVPGDLINGSES